MLPFLYVARVKEIMPRKRVRKTKPSYTEESLQMAVEEVNPVRNIQCPNL
jgi:hypothetical protein